MTGKTITTLTLLMLATLWPTPAFSSECAASLNVRIALSELIRCIAEINDELEIARKEIIELSGRLDTSLIPRGSVIAVESINGCPEGWRQFERGAGKVIIGVGRGKIGGKPLTFRKPWDEGGEETHQLSLAEIPRHNHGVSFALNGQPLPWGPGSHPIPTTARNRASKYNFVQGGGRAHNNMPPFIALFLCERSLNVVK